MTSWKLRAHRNRGQGFTLVEMLAAITVTVMLLGIIAAATQGTSVAVHQASNKMSTYAAARAGFNTMTAKLSQATLNTYLDYYGSASGSAPYTVRTNIAGTFIPVYFGRCSELQFVVLPNIDTTPETGIGQEVYFQCPAAYSATAEYQATQGLLNNCGYYVQYTSNANFEPTLITTPKWRYRLMQAIQPTDALGIYNVTLSTFVSSQYSGQVVDKGVGANPATYALPLVDNVIALVIWPRLPVDQDAIGNTLTGNYTYDSQFHTGTFAGNPPVQPLTANQLPPLVQVTMVAIDEGSATRLDTHGAVPPTAISTALTGLFAVSTQAQYTLDLAALESRLASNHIGFEVFNSTVVMRESKWSQ